MKFFRLLTASVFCASAFALAHNHIVTSANAALPASVDGRPLPTLAPMVEQVQQSLVRIAVQSRVSVRRDPFDDPFFGRFFDNRRSSTRQVETYATGVIIDALQGLILTNEHTVRGASKIRVNLADGRVVDGEVVGSDASTNIALVKIGAVGLQEIALGDSDMLRIGDFVVSIGDPLGEENTLVTGLISSVAETGSVQAHRNFIRSDAASGAGVLVDLAGNIIGFNVGKAAQTSGNARIGFSTPINLALKVKDQLLAYGATQRGFLAVQVQDLTPSLAQAFSIDAQGGGAVVTNVVEGSTAEVAGLEAGDVVLEAGNQKISKGNDLRSVVGQYFMGDALSLKVARQGQELVFEPILESSTSPSKKGQMIHYQLEGATFKETDARQVSTGADRGVRVTKVGKGSVAWRHGVREDDLIVSANRKPVSNLEELRNAVAGKDVVMLNIVRESGALFLLLQ